jgi:hypothetical protein
VELSHLSIDVLSRSDTTEHTTRLISIISATSDTYEKKVFSKLTTIKSEKCNRLHPEVSDRSLPLRKCCLVDDFLRKIVYGV